MPKTDHWRTDLKSPKHPPLIVNCFRCKKEFGIKWVIGRQAYSQKNSWTYWTGENEEERKICDNCLINIYKNEKPFFLAKIKEPKKRHLLSNYISNKDIVSTLTS